MVAEMLMTYRVGFLRGPKGERMNVINLDSRRPRDVTDAEMRMLMRVLVDLRRVWPDAVLVKGLGERGDPWVSFHPHAGGDCDPLLTWTRVGGRTAWLDENGRERPAPTAAGV
jgi:hypothetical protein